MTGNYLRNDGVHRPMETFYNIRGRFVCRRSQLLSTKYSADYLHQLAVHLFALI